MYVFSFGRDGGIVEIDFLNKIILIVLNGCFLEKINGLI